MARGSKPGEHRGGRKAGTPNKPKGERALVKIDEAEAEARALVAAGDPIGRDRSVGVRVGARIRPQEGREGEDVLGKSW